MVNTAEQVATDLAHGGRWTSLYLAGREWLWQRDEPRRAGVRPGAAFADAGGVEECVPTVRGTPDHGAAWSRPWTRDGDAEVADCDEFVLRRNLRAVADEVVATYRLSADPGYRFVWAAHALLDLSVGATVVLPRDAPVRLYPEAAAYLSEGWPAGARYVVDRWPAPFGIALSILGPDDGGAVGASVLECNSVEVSDRAHRLRMTVHAEPGVPTSIALWRNLGGFPPERPYRSIGVEPMLGTVFDLADAGPDDAATVPGSGTLDWELHIRAIREQR